MIVIPPSSSREVLPVFYMRGQGSLVGSELHQGHRHYILGLVVSSPPGHETVPLLCKVEAIYVNIVFLVF